MANTRVRKVAVEALEPEAADQIGYELGKKVGKIGDEAAQRISEIMDIYGIKARIVVQLIDKKTGQILE